MKGKSSSLPFDDITPQAASTKSIPRKTEEFVNYIEYLATSPQLDHSKISKHILQFLGLSKLKLEFKQTVLFALRDLNLPESFWTSLLPTIKSELTEDNKCAEPILIALCSCPSSCIIKEFHNFTFINQFLSVKNANLRYAAFYLIYNFRNFIKIDENIVKATLEQLSSKLPKLLFIVLNLLMFFITIDYPNIQEKLNKYQTELLQIAFTHGHLLNVKHLSFILQQIHPSIQTIISLLPHVSISSACYLLTSMPECIDFSKIIDFPPSAILPNILDIISHPYSDGMRTELLVTALQIIKMSPSHHFFSRVQDVLFASNQAYDFNVIALFADVAMSFGILKQVLAKANESAKVKDIFADLVAISSLMAAHSSIDITTEVFKLLSKQDDIIHWRLAASCIALYMWKQKVYFMPQIQATLEVCQSINDLSVRALFMIYIAQFVPVHLSAPLMQSIKEILFGSQQQNDAQRSKFQVIRTSSSSQLPVLLKIELVAALTMSSQSDELESLAELLKDPIYKMVMERNLEKRQQKLESSRRRISSPGTSPANCTDEPPISPFVLANACEVGLISAALAYPFSTFDLDFMGVHREFIEVSPVYHAMTVEVASVIVPKYRSLCIDMRLSAKGVVPSIVVYFDVPVSLTPPQVPEWSINGLNEGSKVTHRFSFTVNKLTNPFANIRVMQEGVKVLDIKVCLPLIDFFKKVEPEPEMEKCIWNMLHHERKGVKLPDSVWVSNQGCIAVRKGVARATEREFIDMLSSALETRSTVE